VITQRAWLVGVVGFCFYLITIVNDLPSFYYALTWLAAGVLGSSLAIAFLSLIGLRCAWRVPREIVTENFADDAGGPMLEVQLANAGTLNKTGVLIEAHLQRAGEKSDGDAPILSRRFLVEALPSGQSLTTALPLRHLRRGRYKVLELYLIGSDVLGLFSIRKRVAPDATFSSILEDGGEAGSTPGFARRDEILVGPAAVARGSAGTTPTSLARREGGAPMTRSLGSGDDIRGTRLYVAGDDLRHVHWKSTARKGQLVVKEFHTTVQEQSLVVWDGAQVVSENQSPRRKKTATPSTPDIGFNATEWSLRLAASLCRALLESHRPCALLRLDGTPLALGLGMNDEKAASVLTMSQVSEVLASARTNRACDGSEALAPFQARWVGGEVYLATTTMGDASALMTRLKRQGARVTVGLVDAAAFAPVLRMRTSGREYSGPEEISEVTLAAMQALRVAGARVVLVTPQPDSRDFHAPITEAVRRMLEAGEQNLAAQSHAVLGEVRAPQSGAAREKIAATDL
jgi:uncharacterized protein (DUF58 family)